MMQGGSKSEKKRPAQDDDSSDVRARHCLLFLSTSPFIGDKYLLVFDSQMMKEQLFAAMGSASSICCMSGWLIGTLIIICCILVAHLALQHYQFPGTRRCKRLFFDFPWKNFNSW